MTVIKNIFQRHLRLLTTDSNSVKIVTKKSENTPIKMSYTSYESSRSIMGEETPPLIIMHGLFGSKANWNTLSRRFFEKTNPQRKIIAVDSRNHGDSPHSSFHGYPHLAEDVKYLLTNLDIPKACFLGHSVGGRAMMYFALKYPQFVDKLIVADISPIKNSAGFKSIVKILITLKKISLPKQIPLHAARLSVDMQMSRTIHGKGLRTFLLQNLIQKFDGSYAWRINLPALISNFSQNVLKFPEMSTYKFEGPVLFVCGGSSDFIQKSDYEPIKKFFPRAKFAIIDGAGHWLYSDKPKEFSDICIDFLNSPTQQVVI